MLQAQVPQAVPLSRFAVTTRVLACRPPPHLPAAAKVRLHVGRSKEACLIDTRRCRTDGLRLRAVQEGGGYHGGVAQAVLASPQDSLDLSSRTVNRVLLQLQALQESWPSVCWLLTAQAESKPVFSLHSGLFLHSGLENCIADKWCILASP